MSAMTDRWPAKGTGCKFQPYNVTSMVNRHGGGFNFMHPSTMNFSPHSLGSTGEVLGQLTLQGSGSLIFVELGTQQLASLL